MKYSQFLWSVKMVYGALGSSYLEDLYLPDLKGTPTEALKKGVPPKLVWECILKETSQDLELLNIYLWDSSDIKIFMKNNHPF